MWPNIHLDRAKKSQVSQKSFTLQKKKWQNLEWCDQLYNTFQIICFPLWIKHALRDEQENWRNRFVAQQNSPYDWTSWSFMIITDLIASSKSSRRKGKKHVTHKQWTKLDVKSKLRERTETACNANVRTSESDGILILTVEVDWLPPGQFGGTQTSNPRNLPCSQFSGFWSFTAIRRLF